MTRAASLSQACVLKEAQPSHGAADPLWPMHQIYSEKDSHFLANP